LARTCSPYVFKYDATEINEAEADEAEADEAERSRDENNTILTGRV